MNGEGLCDEMRGRPFPVSHRVQRNEGRKTCIACGKPLDPKTTDAMFSNRKEAE